MNMDETGETSEPRWRQRRPYEKGPRWFQARDFAARILEGQGYDILGRFAPLQPALLRPSTSLRKETAHFDNFWRRAFYRFAIVAKKFDAGLGPGEYRLVHTAHAPRGNWVAARTLVERLGVKSESVGPLQEGGRDVVLVVEVWSLHDAHEFREGRECTARLEDGKHFLCRRAEQGTREVKTGPNSAVRVPGLEWRGSGGPPGGGGGWLPARAGPRAGRGAPAGRVLHPRAPPPPPPPACGGGGGWAGAGGGAHT